MRRIVPGLLTVLAVAAAMAAYRHWFIEPRHWGATCAAADAPLSCAPRAALMWLQHYWLWGLAALGTGAAAFVTARQGLAVAAVALGVVAVLNYNATWGVAGAALGAWAWLRPRDGVVA